MGGARELQPVDILPARLHRFFAAPDAGQFFALPIFIVAGLGARYGLRKVRQRIRLDESDPLSRARKLN